MDDLVLQAMKRWPDVPAVYGWLRLDQRGQWHLIDRNQPGFDERTHGLGSPITSPQIIEFIGRNYTNDGDGRWYWQNGPQRAFVDLAVAPLILRVIGSGADAGLVTHTGQAVDRIDAAWQTPEGELILETELGPGAIHDLDLAALQLTEHAPRPPDDATMSVSLLGRTLPLRSCGDGLGPRFERRPRPAGE